MRLALVLLFAACATPSYVDYARADAPPYPEPPAERYLGRPDVQRAQDLPFKPQPEPAPRP